MPKQFGQFKRTIATQIDVEISWERCNNEVLVVKIELFNYRDLNALREYIISTFLPEFQTQAKLISNGEQGD